MSRTDHRDISRGTRAFAGSSGAAALLLHQRPASGFGRLPRLGLILAALTASGMTVVGTAMAQPAPRVVFDAPLPTASGFVLPFASDDRGCLAVGKDGTHYVLMNEIIPGREIGTVRDARLELLAAGPDGTVKFRRSLPVDGKPGLSGYSTQALGMAVARSGDLAVFIGLIPDDDPTRRRQPRATLLRLAPDGTMKKRAAVGAPLMARDQYDTNGHYVIYALVPTPDNALLLGGGFGSGPHMWWMGKTSLDGVRLWQSGPGRGFPDYVLAIGPRTGGTWLSVIHEEPRNDAPPTVIQRNAADGRLLGRTGVRVHGFVAAVLRDRNVMVEDPDEQGKGGAVVFIDDGGRISHRAPWPFKQTSRLIADGDGFIAIADDTIVRADERGTIRWRSAAARYSEVARTDDGQVVALVRKGEAPEDLRLVRFADP